jgi:transcription elongation factor Elf1
MNSTNGLVAFDCPICANAIEMSAKAFQSAKSVRCANCGSSVDLAPNRARALKSTKLSGKSA